jgi:L,D-peptidoglycan transpeptidase YkuD (ErfK/YbiS/YcfS/YnhG family)
MKISVFANGLILCSAVFISACTEPPVPPEIKRAEAQEMALWKEGAPDYIPVAYHRYKQALRDSRDGFIHEKGRLTVLRDYDRVRADFRGVLRTGETIMADLKDRKGKLAAAVDAQYALCEKKVKSIEKLSGVMNEGRLARRNLTKAQLLMAETVVLRQKEKFDECKTRLFEAGMCLSGAEAALRPIISRYADRALVAKWKRWVEDTVAESRSRSITAIIVSKAERNLFIYRNGKIIKTYDVGLGRNGLNDKMFSGDNATPEGKYHITQKFPQTQYYKALLFNYPNDEDRRQFAQAKKEGLIPRYASIGNWLEIHGGGDDGMTYGCISLDNHFMDEVYDYADVGTPVTIVGSLEYDNIFSTLINEL